MSAETLAQLVAEPKATKATEGQVQSSTESSGFQRRNAVKPQVPSGARAFRGGRWATRPCRVAKATLKQGSRKQQARMAELGRVTV